VRRAAPDPADEPGAGRPPARGDARRGTGARGARGATGTDTPPEPVIDARANGHGAHNGHNGHSTPTATPPTAPFYPAQRRREDTWPPPSGDGAPAPRVGSGPLPGPPLPGPPPAPPPPLPPTGPAPVVDPGEPTTGLPIAAPGVAVPEVPAAPPDEPPQLAEDGSETVDPDELPDELADNPAAAEGWALVRAAQDGDTAAFGQLFDRYHDTVFRFVLYRLGDRPAAEDLTQETFVRAYRRITSVSYQGRDIGAWFVTIARNLVLDHVKSSRYRLESATAEVADVAPGSLRPGPETEVIAGATHAELLKCVAKLGDDQQECIALRFLQGLSVAETAEIMGRNEGAVKALQHRAVRRLAQLLPEGLR
jgi:RNA polymerase sigma-70 factor, ECF subfamily